MKASEFVQTYAKRSYDAWEAAAVELFRTGAVPENPWVPIALSATLGDGKTHSAIVQVSADYLTIGEGDDTLRLPLTPGKAQEILNLDGSLLPTSWLDYQIWRQSIKVPRQGMVPNRGADLNQYAAHDAIVKGLAAQADWTMQGGKALSGHKKDIVVSNIYKPGVVLIHGWYKPAPDVYDDGLPWNTLEDKQPKQAKSNVHGAGYVDYSHGIRKVHPIMMVDGSPMSTDLVYADPVLSKLVSNEGPLRTLRYPAPNRPNPQAASVAPRPVSAHVWPVPTDPSYARRGFTVLVEQAHNSKKVS